MFSIAMHFSSSSIHFFSFAESCHVSQMTTKFRDEGKPKHGVLRAREFLMKGTTTTFYGINRLLEVPLENPLCLQICILLIAVKKAHRGVMPWHAKHMRIC